MLMLGTFIDLGTDFATSTLTISGYIISDLAPYIGLVVGVLLVAGILSLLIRSFLMK